MPRHTKHRISSPTLLQSAQPEPSFLTRRHTSHAALSVVVSALFLLITTQAPAEPPYWTRAVGFGGASDDWGQAIKVDSLGNVYATGYFSSTARFGARNLVSFGDTDIYLAKFGPLGNLLWIVQAGGAGSDQGDDLTLDAAGNAYVTGWFTDTATFHSADGNSKTVTGTGETIFLVKYSPSGNLVWFRQGDSSFGINRGHGVALDGATGAVVVTGVGQGKLSFSSPGRTLQVPGPGTWHMFLVRCDGDGNFEWGEWNEAAPNSIANGIAVDSAGSVYVAGWFEATTTFHSSDGRDQTVHGFSGPVQSGPDYPDDAFIVKYDNKGALKWVNHVGGYKAIANKLSVSPDGKLAVTGFIGNIDTGSSVQAETIVTSQAPGTSLNLGGGQFTHPYNPDVFIANYDGAGVLTKAERFGGTDQDAGSGIAYDSHGNLYVAGVFRGSVALGSQMLTGTQESNLFVLKYDASAQLAWARSANGAGTQSFENNPAISPGSDGSVWITGAFANTAAFDGSTLKSAGMNDSFLAELSALAGTYFMIKGSANIALVNQPVTFTTTSVPHDKSLGCVTGTVTFKDGTITLGSAPISGSHASITTSGLGIGKHLIRAYYSGNNVFATNTASLTQVITQLMLSTAKLNFGNQAVDTTSAPQMVTITNVGSTALSIAKLFVTGNFRIQASTCGTTLAAGAPCTATIVFQPAGTSNRYGNLWIYDSGGGSPQKVALTGIGM